jgi:hypothetical protein
MTERSLRPLGAFGYGRVPRDPLVYPLTSHSLNHGARHRFAGCEA